MEKEIKAARFIAGLLDNKFEIFGIKFGINALFEIVPGLGDAVATLLSLYIIALAFKVKAPANLLAQMISNVVITFIFGLIPFLGDVFYIFYKPNIRNVSLLNRHIDYVSAAQITP